MGPHSWKEVLWYLLVYLYGDYMEIFIPGSRFRVQD